MATTKAPTGPDYSRLNSTLANSKTQTSNNALFQTVSGLINGVKTFQDLITAQLQSFNGSLNQLFGSAAALIAELEDRNSVKFGVSVINEASPDTVPDGVLTVVTYDTTVFDDGEMFDSPSKLVAPIGAQYLVTGRISFDGNSTGFRKIYLTFNGSSNILGEFKYQPAGVSMVVPICQLISLAKNDYIELYIDQNSTADVTVVGALEMVRISYS